MESTLEYFIKKYLSKRSIDLKFLQQSEVTPEYIREKLTKQQINCTYFDLSDLGNRIIDFPFLFLDKKRNTINVITSILKEKVYLGVLNTPLSLPYSRTAFVNENDGIIFLLLDENYEIQKGKEFNLYIVYCLIAMLFLTVGSWISFNKNDLAFGIFGGILIASVYMISNFYWINSRINHQTRTKCDTLATECGSSQKISWFTNLNLFPLSIFVAIFIAILFYAGHYNDLFQVILRTISFCGIIGTSILFIFNLFIRSKPCLHCFLLHLIYIVLFICFSLHIKPQFHFKSQYTYENLIPSLTIISVSAVLFLLNNFIVMFLVGFKNRKFDQQQKALITKRVLNLPKDLETNFIKALLKLNSISDNDQYKIGYYVLIFFDPNCSPCYAEAMNLYKYYKLTIKQVLLVPVFDNKEPWKRNEIYNSLRIKIVKEQFNCARKDMIKAKDENIPDSIGTVTDNYLRNLNLVVQLLNLTSYPLVLDKGIAS